MSLLAIRKLPAMQPAAASSSSPDRSERIKRQERTRKRRKNMEKPLIQSKDDDVASSLTAEQLQQLSSLNAILFREALEEKADGMSEEEQVAYIKSNSKYSDPAYYEKTLLQPLLFNVVKEHMDQEDSELLSRIFMKDLDKGKQILLSSYPAALRRNLIALKPSEREGLPKLLMNLNGLFEKFQMSGAITGYLEDKLSIREQRRRDQKGLSNPEEEEGEEGEDEREEEEERREEGVSSDGWWNEYESNEVRALKALAAKYYVLVEMGVEGELEELTPREFFMELQSARQDLQLLLTKGSGDPVVGAAVAFLKTEVVKNGQLDEDLGTLNRWIEFIKAAEAFYCLREFYPVLIEQQLSHLVEVDAAAATWILEDFDRPKWWMTPNPSGGDGEQVDEQRIQALSSLGPQDLVQLRFLVEVLSSGFNEGVLLKWSIHPFIGPKLRSGTWFEGLDIGQMSGIVRESMEEALASEDL